MWFIGGMVSGAAGALVVLALLFVAIRTLDRWIGFSVIEAVRDIHELRTSVYGGEDDNYDAVGENEAFYEKWLGNDEPARPGADLEV